MLIVSSTEVEHFGHWQHSITIRKGIQSHSLYYKPAELSQEYAVLGNAIYDMYINPNQYIGFYSLLVKAPSQSARLLGNKQEFIDFKNADSHREELFFKTSFSMEEAEELASFQELELQFYNVREDKDRQLLYPVSNFGFKEALIAFNKLENGDTDN